ncbi:MAG: M23 family metallopeptidase [Myxococcaceae bacterium]|nr:M23 family metallopeptidase [Myxococcaceae bacterium]
MFRTSSRGLLDFLAAALCLWAAAWHTPVGALTRSAVAKVAGSRSTARPLLAYFSGGLYDAREVEVPLPATVLPDDLPSLELPLASPGASLGRGAWAVLARPGGVTSEAEALRARFGLGPVDSPEAVASVLERARAEFGTDDAAVLALFAGPELARYAVSRARAEGDRPTLEALARQLPPGRGPVIEAASQALMLGTAYSLSWPVAPGTRVTSPFGFRTHPTLGTQHLHTGVDLSVPEGTAVKVVADGVVKRASEDAVNGKVVIIDHGRGVTTAYCHNSRVLVTTGQTVRAGDVISESGSTGRSTGPHLHYQLELGRRPVDPFIFRGRKAVVVELPAPPTPPKPPGPSKALKAAFDQVAIPPEGTEAPP